MAFPPFLFQLFSPHCIELARCEALAAFDAALLVNQVFLARLARDAADRAFARARAAADAVVEDIVGDQLRANARRALLVAHVR